MTTCLDDVMVLELIEGRLVDPMLAAVDDHLDSCVTCRDVIAQLARTQSPAHVLERGRTIGRYVIGELLGSGAMGRVYSAWQPELDRRVAIKVLHDDAPGGRARLVLEAQAMARLDHPNIVGVHEVGTTDDGVYVAMDLVEGETLRAWAEQPRPWRQVVAVLIDVARGIAAVHAAGVIHRDVKPDNVIVGADGRARLGDFGLARAGAATQRRDAAGADRQVLATGTPGTSVAGTPAYMAPEILRGGGATPASDVFSFGVLAFEVLCGRRPFPGRTWSELARSIEGGAGPAIRSAPAWLDGAIRRCLAADPRRRPTSLTTIAELFADRLQRRKPARWIAGILAAAVLASGVTFVASRREPTASCELGAVEVATVWDAAARTRVQSLGPTALAAIDHWAAQWASERDAVCAAAQVEPAPKLAARQRCLDHQRIELVALIDRAAAKPGTSSRVDLPALAIAAVPGRLDDRMIDAVAALAPADCRSADVSTADAVPLDPDRAAVVRKVQTGLPAVRAAVALGGDARPVVAQAAALVEQARAAGHAPTLAESLLVHADALRISGRLEDAALAARDSVAAAERGHDDQTASRAWLARVAVAGNRRELGEAEDFAAIAGAAIDRAGAPPRLVAQLVRLRALVAYNRGQLALVERLLGEARTRFTELSGERSLDVAMIESSLGSTARAAGDLDTAESHHRTALAIDRELRGPHHPDVARDLHNLAGVLRLRGDLDLAFATYQEALAIEIASRGATSVEAGLTHNSLGLVKLARRDWSGAREQFELALSALSTEGHGDRAFAEHNLGIVAAATGKHLEALEHYARASAVYAATIGDAAEAPIRLYLDRARSLAGLARIDAARTDARRALDAATRAQIAWIAEDAETFLATPQMRQGSAPRVALDRRPSISFEPVPTGAMGTVPVRAPEAKPAQLPPVVPVRKRDVGTYGASQP